MKLHIWRLYSGGFTACMYSCSTAYTSMHFNIGLFRLQISDFHTPVKDNFYSSYQLIMITIGDVVDENHCYISRQCRETGCIVGPGCFG